MADPNQEPSPTPEESPETEGEPREKGDEVSEALQRVARGEREAKNELFELLFDDLRHRAAQYFQRQPPGHTLQPTALVSEAYMRLVKTSAGPWNDHEHFLRAAARAMRHVLVEAARKRRTLKRDAGRSEQDIAELEIESEDHRFRVLDLDEALIRLREVDPPMAQLFEMRFFAGATLEEAARALGTSLRTLQRRLAHARSWLYAELV